MKKFITYDKLSKKAKKDIDSKKRRLWSDYGCMSPIIKTIPDKRKEQNRRLCREKIR